MRPVATRRRSWVAVWGLVAVVSLPAPLSAQAPTPEPFQNPVRKALKEGRAVVGATVTTPSPDVAATLSRAGFDFLWFEMEHSPITLESVHSMILAMRGFGTMPFTRVPINEPWLAKRVLDAGSLGVIFPFTSTRELAEQAVKSCKYPPQGIRGFGPYLSAPRWDFVGQPYPQFASENVMVIVIIEQKQAIENLDAIASVPGIDVLFIGVNDLSYSMGIGGQTGHPMIQSAIDQVLAAGKKYRIPVGYPAGNPDEINKLVARGFRFFQASSDMGLMRSEARDLLSRVQGREEPPAKPPTSIYGDR